MTLQDTATKHHILRERIQAAERIQQHELKQASTSENTIWKDYGSQTTDYSLAFPDLLQTSGYSNFADFLTHYKRQNQWKRLHIMDVAAPIASFIGQHALIDSGIAVTLTDTRTQQQKFIDIARQHFLVTGNLFQRRTWRSINTMMQQVGIPAFEFIMVRPYAGMMDKVDELTHAHFCFSILQRLYKLLSPDNGLLITEVPYYPQQESYFSAYIQQLNHHNIKTVYQQPDSNRQYGYRYALMLTRSRISPPTLPKPL